MQEFNLRFSGQQMIKYGRDIQNTGEILLPYHLIRAFGLTPQYLLNAQNIVFHMLDGFGAAYSGKVVGIFNPNFFELGALYSIGAGGERTRFIAVFMGYCKEAIPSYPREILRFFMDCIYYAEEIRQYIEENYYGLFASWGNQSIATRLDLTARILTFTQNIVLVLIGSIGLALLCFLYSVIDYNIKQKGGYHGMMRAMGMKSTSAINFCEMIIMSFFSAIISSIIFFPAVLALNGLEISFGFAGRYTLNPSRIVIGLSFVFTVLLVVIINIVIVAVSSRLNTHKSITKSLRL